MRTTGLWLIVKVKFVFNQDWLDFLFIKWTYKFCYVKHHHRPKLWRKLSYDILIDGANHY